MSRTSLQSGIGALATVCALAAGGPAAGKTTYITFSVDSGQNTYAVSINAGGAVTGYSCGDDFCDGFVRAADGTIATFEGPSLETMPTGINRDGTIVGTYFSDTGSFRGYGFLRRPDGKLITFDPTGSTNTVAYAINDGGVITGYYNTHGFLRAADGTFTTFDPSGSTATTPTAINANGDVAGFYTDTSGGTHGFLRTADGTITSFDVKGVPFMETYGINSKDAIVGSYGDGATGFERTPGGKIKTFSFEEALNLLAPGINDEGEIVGYYNMSQSPYGYAFVGSLKSGFKKFNVPHGSETQAFSINDKGVIAGSYYPTNGYLTGFLRMP